MCPADIAAGVEQHVRLSEADIAAIALANPYYRDRDFQYSHSGYQEMPPIDALIALAESLWKSLREFCIANREHHFGKHTAVAKRSDKAMQRTTS